MQRKNVFYLTLVLIISGIAIVEFTVADAQATENLKIVYEKELLSVDAQEVKIEPLFLELGKQWRSISTCIPRRSAEPGRNTAGFGPATKAESGMKYSTGHHRMDCCFPVGSAIPI